MKIKLTHDGTGPGDPMEHCAFCRAKTRYWYAPKDVAVCPACSEVKSVSEVPTKQQWLEKERSHP